MLIRETPTGAVSQTREAGVSELEQQVRAGRALPPLALRKAIREAAGVTQAALAVDIGVHRITVVRWESGDREPKGIYRARYATALREIEESLR
jgi:DNA-binding transcriptional regulator YiaG